VSTRPIRTRLRNADAAGAHWTALFGDDEVRDQSVSLRDMAGATTATLPLAESIARVLGNNGSQS
jgi:histidyl-tRNA synthetase